jgi:hypothetical protein
MRSPLHATARLVLLWTVCTSLGITFVFQYKNKVGFFFFKFVLKLAIDVQISECHVSLQLLNKKKLGIIKQTILGIGI